MRAVRALSDDITRWNTSCCGMEPSIMVMAAAKKKVHSLAPPFCGKNWNFPSRAANSTTRPAPPARSAENQAMAIRPMAITIICTKSVIATDHMPPNSVYTSTMAVPTTMPAVTDIAPCVSKLNTSPSAVICAATQPR